MSSLYDVLRRPLVTEKSNYLLSNLHQYSFEVKSDATRSQVKDAVEKIFEVSVVRVNIINQPGKRTRRSRSRKLVLKDTGTKKAIVTLKSGERIPFFEGVE